MKTLSTLVSEDVDVDKLNSVPLPNLVNVADNQFIRSDVRYKQGLKARTVEMAEERTVNSIDISQEAAYVNAPNSG